MAVAHDALTVAAALSTATTQATNHTPVGTPKGVIVRIPQDLSTADQISGVTYGGVAMTRLVKADRPSATLGSVYIYFLGSGIPTGTQSVAITSTGTAAKRASIATVTAAVDTTVSVSPSNNGTTANPSLSVTPTAASVIYYVLFHDANTAFTTVEAGSTHETNHDFGSEVTASARKTASGATTIGYTVAAGAWVHAAAAIQEVAGSALTVDPIDSISLSDSILAAERGVQAVASSVVVVDDLLAREANFAAVASSVVTVDDVTTKESNFVSAASDPLSLSDSAAVAAGRQAAAADTASVSDSASQQAGKEANVPDTLSVSDSPSTQSGRTASAADTASVADNTARESAFAVAPADTATAADTQSFARGEGLSDSLGTDRNEQFNAQPADYQFTGIPADLITFDGSSLVTFGANQGFVLQDAFVDGDFAAEWDLQWDTGTSDRDIFNCLFWANKTNAGWDQFINGFMFRLDTSSGSGWWRVTDGGHATGLGDLDVPTVLRGVPYRVRLTATGLVVRALVTRLDTSAVHYDSTRDLTGMVGSAWPTAGVFGQKLDGAGTATFPARLTRMSVASADSLRDVATPSSGVLTTANDTVSVADTTAAARGVQQALADNVAVADAATLARAISASIADAAAVSDAQSFQYGLVRAITDALSVADAAATATGKQATITDVLVVSDEISSGLDRGIADALGISDSLFTLLAGSYIHHQPPLDGDYDHSADGLVVAVVADGLVSVYDAAGLVVSVNGAGEIVDARAGGEVPDHVTAGVVEPAADSGVGV